MNLTITLGFVGFFAVTAVVLGYVFWRLVTGKGFYDADVVFMLIMAPIGGLLLGFIVGNTIDTFGTFMGSVICTATVMFFVVQSLKLQSRTVGS